MKNRRKIIFSIINIVMSDFGIKVIINIIIGIIVFGGFFIFWGRSAGWFVKGGFIYEHFQNKKKSKKKKSNK